MHTFRYLHRRSIRRAFSSAATLDPPRLLGSFELNTIKVSVFHSSCLICSPPPSTRPALVVPANPNLTSTSRFPYFPKSGPVPTDYTGKGQKWQPLGYVTSWGGMDVGEGMVYSSQTVDGIAHREAGEGLKEEIRGLSGGLLGRWKALLSNNNEPPILVNTGDAIATSAHNLSPSFSKLIHTPPPFKDDDGSRELLGKCYESALMISGDAVVTPLIGSGCRGFTYAEAAEVFWSAIHKIDQRKELHVMICVNDERVGEVLLDVRQ